MLNRALQGHIETALQDTPVVFINGPRQSGKTTLARQIVEKADDGRLLSLDDPTVLAAATEDPAGFIEGLSGFVVIDEVQRAPELFLPLKLVIDREQVPGRFLLTGSADVLLLPNLADSLAGRMEIVTLWPFSQAELEGKPSDLIAALFDEGFPKLRPAPQNTPPLTERVARGGYPRAVAREPARRADWFASYITAILQRDIRDLANIAGLADMPKLLRMLATRQGSTVNYAELARSLGYAQPTLKHYETLLKTTFIVYALPAWHANLRKRLVKSSKLYLCDSGLTTYLMGAGAEQFVNEPDSLGGPLEQFVVMEILKLCASSTVRCAPYHYRTHSGEEVDIVLEDTSGKLVAIEVKVGRSVGANDFRHLRALRDAAGDRFHRGVVLYGGEQMLPFGERLSALPISALWRADTESTSG